VHPFFLTTLIASGALVLLGATACRLPSIGAGLILRPPLRKLASSPPPACREVTFTGDGVTLRGWRGHGAGPRRGTMIYLHGVADNRASGTGVLERFRARGFDVLAYDSRGHGQSEAAGITYGFYEKRDLQRVMDTVDAGPIVLVGSSLGAAVALQVAAEDPRVSAVVAAESFSDLRTVVAERAPFFFTADTIAKAIALAENQGQFHIDAVNPAAAAARIKSPVLLVHGDADTDTPPDHARRLHAALAGPKRLLLVPGARHGESLREAAVWNEVERWLDTTLAGTPPANESPRR
jgi:pimeloyl-ACP methyl ester carboxylesterase